MRKCLLVLAIVAAFATAAGSAAARGPAPIVCDAACNGGDGGGWTGCTQVSASDSGGIPWVASYRHYLVVNYCKRYGIITSLSIAAHGCDSSGWAGCNAGPAWRTGGGVGNGWASFEGHATYSGSLIGSPFTATSIVHIDIPFG